MGVDQTVTFAGPPPAWADVAALLRGLGWPVQLRMIDGEPAFPDEAPAEGWRELRVASPQGGMVALRRGADRVTCVAWGDADAALRQAWNALAWAFAEAGGGAVQTAAGPADAETFRRRADLPEALRAPGG
jgi:hypothetical protein